MKEKTKGCKEEPQKETDKKGKRVGAKGGTKETHKEQDRKE